MYIAVLPTVFAIIPGIALGSGSVSLSISAAGFGTRDFSSILRAHISGTDAQSTVWRSDSQAVIKTCASIARFPHVGVSVLQTAAIISRSLSYFGPVLLSTLITNNPASGSVVLTMSGTGFGFQVSSFVVRMGGTSQAVHIWISDSCVAIKSQAIVAYVTPLAITQSGRVGNVSSAINTDRVVVSTISAISPPTTGSVHEIYGLRIRNGKHGCFNTCWHRRFYW